jgi:hypothetical protein
MECPFILRGNLTSPDYFYGRLDVVRKIFGYLNKTNPQSISIIGQRRIGKSFLLQFINLCEETRNAYLGKNSERFTFIYWDLTLKAPTDPVEFKARLLNILHDSLPKELKVAFNPNVDVERIEDELLEGVEILENENHHVVLFFDEFSAITNNPNFDVIFFSQKRSLGQSPSLAFITATAEPLSELCHSEQVAASPYFNIFSTIHLTLMSISEVEEIVLGIFDRAGVGIEKGAVTELTKLSGGHPCVLAILMDILWKDLRSGKAMTQPQIAAYRAPLYEQFKGDLKYLWIHLRPEERDVLKTLLTDQMTINDLGQTICNNLHNKSFVRLEKNKTFLFSPLMVDFLSEHGNDNATIRRLFGKRHDYDQNMPILLETLLVQHNDLPEEWREDIKSILKSISSNELSVALHKCSRVFLDKILRAIWEKDFPDRADYGDAEIALKELNSLAFDDGVNPPTFDKTVLQGLWFIKHMGTLGSHPDKYQMSLNECVATIVTVLNVCEKLVDQGYE